MQSAGFGFHAFLESRIIFGRAGLGRRLSNVRIQLINRECLPGDYLAHQIAHSDDALELAPLQYGEVPKMMTIHEFHCIVRPKSRTETMPSKLPSEITSTAARFFAAISAIASWTVASGATEQISFPFFFRTELIDSTVMISPSR
jgi:hypothetical protein